MFAVFHKQMGPQCWGAGGPCWAHVSGDSPCSAMLCLVHPGQEPPLLWLALAFVPKGAGIFPSCRANPLPYGGVHSPGEIKGDAGRCLWAHPKQKDLPPFPTPLLACCRSLELVLMGKVVGFVCGLKSETRMG